MRKPWSDDRAERVLGAVACLVLATILGMVVFVFAKAWPSFSHNGLGWLGRPTTAPSTTSSTAIFNSPANPKDYQYELGAFSLLWGTLLPTAGAVVLGVVISVLSAIFIVEFAPPPVRRVMTPVVRLLAAVPSVIYGLIGILVLVPFVGDHVITQERKQSVLYVVQLTGTSLLVAVLILTVMIVPIMVSIMADALRGVPRNWTEGAAALGVNRWRVMWTNSVRASRPAFIAAIVLATARALGEAIMLSMVSGSQGFSPNPLDGVTFFLEPTRPLAATIVDNAEGLSVKPFGQTIYASPRCCWSPLLPLARRLGGQQPLKRYGMGV